jgi:hypothetical protein
MLGTTAQRLQAIVAQYFRSPVPLFAPKSKGSRSGYRRPDAQKVTLRFGRSSRHAPRSSPSIIARVYYIFARWSYTTTTNVTTGHCLHTDMLLSPFRYVVLAAQNNLRNMPLGIDGKSAERRLSRFEHTIPGD